MTTPRAPLSPVAALSPDAEARLAALRADVPILARDFDGRRAVYLDSAATTLRPLRVLEAENSHALLLGGSVHRGRHLFSELATDAFEDARRRIARAIGADPREVIFTSGTTAALNLVALGWPLLPGQHVVTTRAEHHAVLLPFQARAPLRAAPVEADGRVDPERIAALIDGDTALVALAWASNVTGAIQPVKEIIALAHARGVPVLLDAAQAVPHLDVDVEALGADLLCFSGHKLLGPTGVGVLWGRRETLDRLGAPLRGGGAVRHVSLDGVSLRDLPERLEPGTPNVSGVLGLAAAFDVLEDLGRDVVAAHEARLAARLVERLAELPGARLLGPPPGTPRLALASLALHKGGPSSDHLAMLLSDRHRILVRSGHLCAHPFFDALDLPGALRASAYLYNTVDEIDVFADALVDTLGVMARQR